MPLMVLLAMMAWYGLFALLVHRIGGTEGLMGEQARRFQHDAAMELAWTQSVRGVPGWEEWANGALGRRPQGGADSPAQKGAPPDRV
jgi:hypothetical protein